MSAPSRRIFLFFSVILLSLFVKLFLFDILFVSGPSMEPALRHGTLVFQYKLAYGVPLPLSNRYLVRWAEPAAGDIVIYPWLGRFVIKRCVAAAGTELVFRSDSGYSVQAGEVLIPLNGEQYSRLSQARQVPPGMIFTLGDNREHSRDSRDYGFVSLDSIRGKVLWK